MRKILNEKVFVAMSGGVDSSVAAALLKKEGYDVTGVHMLCWEGCENNRDKQDAMRVAAVLDIPFLVWDFKKEYREAVFNYMVREYSAGRTPNPDVMCNKEIKFGIFLKRALEAGADFIATGHYVKKSGSALLQAKDKSKDQSYFLWTLTQDQLWHSLFPIGGYLKSEVRGLARGFGLSVAEKKDSQGLCFVGKIDFGEFIKNEIPKKIGAIVSPDGKKIGELDGALFYTVGQRHVLNLGGQTAPVYVAVKNLLTNTLVVSQEKDSLLYKKELFAENFNWIDKIPAIPFSCQVRIRYRQPLQEAVLYEDGRVEFLCPQRAVAPGQSIVFYAPSEALAEEGEETEMLGGAIIKE
ncbi:MAG: tRNA 2-thiouridine(34) synthase MnmA [Candidatus Giovannonibacteria bacterium]|nr:tRNA 2-thiouridine(34) synthase MnmA [Candidatus Giovannonibacteria bacterium]